MPLSDFVADLPAEKQEAYKAELARYTEIASIDRHPEFQRQLSLKHETTMANWQKEKLPVMIEEEIKKRGTKQPWEIEIEKMRAENADLQRQALLKDRKAQAIAELSKIGLDADLADFVLHEDESVFRANIERLTGKVTSWRDSAIKEKSAALLGQKPPQAGASGSMDFSKMSVTEVMQYAQKGEAEKAAVMQWQKK